VALAALVVPVKSLVDAKTRLEPLGSSSRSALAFAFAQDTVECARRCSRVAEVAVLTSDSAVRRHFAGQGVRTLSEPRGRGLNRSLRHGVGVLAADHPDCFLGAILADLPALRPSHLDAALASAFANEFSFVPDAGGVGSTLLVSSDTRHFKPRFGFESAARHSAIGAVDLAGSAGETLRHDVDTVQDLSRAIGLGVGPATTRALADLLASFDGPTLEAIRRRPNNEVVQLAAH
jgi:2-phospho-L-lactate guanylyltransferase